MIKYSNILTVKCLRKICKIYKIKNEKYNKSFILEILNKYSAARVIQQKIRETLDFNNICPISHEEIRYPWICIKNNSKYIYYDFDTFVIYLNKMSDFRDPCTRIKLSNKKIEEINRLIIYYHRKSSNKLIVSDDMIRVEKIINEDQEANAFYEQMILSNDLINLSYRKLEESYEITKNLSSAQQNEKKNQVKNLVGFGSIAISMKGILV